VGDLRTKEEQLGHPSPDQ